MDHEVLPNDPITLRDETNEELNDEVHGQLRDCTALETELQDKVTPQFMAVI